MSVTDYLFIIVSCLCVSLGTKNYYLEQQLAVPQDVHCVQSQEIYDQGYYDGYSDGIDDGTAYENASQFSDDLITDDQIQAQDPDFNPFQ